MNLSNHVEWHLIAVAVAVIFNAVTWTLLTCDLSISSSTRRRWLNVSMTVVILDVLATVYLSFSGY